jgi:hypothetical protein
MSDTTTNRIVEEITEAIDIPAYAYEKAEARYKDLSKWFGRKEAFCYDFSPHIYSQGSFRLGTVIRPLDDDGDYDLDMGCRLRTGVTKSTHTQQQLKEMVGADIEAYRVARGIKDKMEKKHRCWRLNYADVLKFHLDVVPSIPETFERQRLIKEAVIRTGAPAELSMLIANLTGAITDDRMWNYSIINDAWRLSNSEGFAHWFESRMKLAKALMESLALRARAAKVDKLPANKWKSPLQRCVQLLKRHRDNYFKDDTDGKPPSIIITTLSAKAYQGEGEIADALDTILSTMGKLVNPVTPRIPNPINPAEDFADRWSDPAAREHNLEKKFWVWLRQAQTDFDTIRKERKIETIIEETRDIFGVMLNEKDLNAILRRRTAGGLLKTAVVPGGLSFPDKPLVPNKPAGFALRVL